MTRSSQHPNGPQEHRERITLAVTTGVITGAARALAGWLLDYLTTSN